MTPDIESMCAKNDNMISECRDRAVPGYAGSFYRRAQSRLEQSNSLIRQLVERVATLEAELRPILAAINEAKWRSINNEELKVINFAPTAIDRIAAALKEV